MRADFAASAPVSRRCLLARIAPLLLAATLCRAQELKTPGEQVCIALARAVADGSEEAAVALLDEVGALYRFPASPEEAQALLRQASDALRSAHPRIQAAAVDALGQTGAEQAAALVEPLLRSPKQDAVGYATLRAAGRIRAALLAPGLLRVAARTEEPLLAEQALAALGDFCRAPTELRKQVVQKTLDLCDSLSRKRGWERLRAPSLRALQRLLGRRMNSVDQFADWWRAYRGEKEPFGP